LTGSTLLARRAGRKLANGSCNQNGDGDGERGQSDRLHSLHHRLQYTTGGESGTKVRTEDDKYGYRWMILSNPAGSIEDLAVGINAVSGSIEEAGHGERLLCAVFAFHDAQGRKIYFIYNYKRGHWYPFVPEGGAGEQRTTERELQLKAQIGQELPIEPEIERWFPLWGTPI